MVWSIHTEETTGGKIKMQQRGLSSEFVSLLVTIAALQAALLEVAHSDISNEEIFKKFEQFVKEGFVADFNEFQRHHDRRMLLGVRNTPKITDEG